MISREIHIHPRSKRDQNLPYTYEARVDILAGQGREPVYDHYFSDTLCGLVECLDGEGIEPSDVKLFGIYRKQQAELDTDLCADDDGAWLMRPQLCRVLETHYRHTREECYRGHVEKSECSFEDRERAGTGPHW